MPSGRCRALAFAVIGLSSCRARAVPAALPVATVNVPVMPVDDATARGGDAVAIPESCGVAVLERMEGEARGLGKKHPRLVALDAKIAGCRRPVDVPREVCADLYLERKSLELDGYGLRHPRVTLLDQQLSICAQPVRVSKARCAALVDRGSRMQAEGLGFNHPEVQRNRARVEACDEARKASAPVPGRAVVTVRGTSGDVHGLDAHVAYIEPGLVGCAPIEPTPVVVVDRIEVTLEIDGDKVRGRAGAGGGASPQTLSCVTIVASGAGLLGSPRGKVDLVIELTHAYRE